MTVRLHVTATALAAAFLLLAPKASDAFTSTVDQEFGAETNVVGVGRFVEEIGGPAVALWDLNATVTNTDFANLTLDGGDDGIQYVMRNDVFGSVDTNIVTFNVNPLNGETPTISLSQSPYNDIAGWNGGNLPSDISQFRMTWDGGGLATIRDPLDQLSDLADFAQVESGTWVQFNDYQVLNSEDSWGVTLPQGVDSITLNWNSSNPTAGSDLTNEWVTFDSSFTPSPTPLPEPGAAAMLVLGLVVGFAALRKRD